MTDREVLGYLGLLAVSGLLLLVLAALGFGQRATPRIVDGLFGLVFLGYAGYLVWAQPDTVYVFFYAFAVPVLALAHAVRARRARARRLAAASIPPYEAPPAAGRAPFPEPPGPLDPQRSGELPPRPMYPAGLPAGVPADPATAGSAVSGLPSGLPAVPPPAPGPATGRPGRPSGLPNREPAEAAYRARHSAAEHDVQQPVDRFAQHAYGPELSGGRHRWSDADPADGQSGRAPHRPPPRGRPAQ